MTILAGKNDESVVKIISSEDHPICYEEVNGETVDPFKIDADTLEGKSVQDIVNLVPNPDLSGYAKSTEVESLKTSVSEGKKLVAAAVTGKGVNTAADSTFQAIANNINSIETVKPWLKLNSGEIRLSSTSEVGRSFQWSNDHPNSLKLIYKGAEYPISSAYSQGSSDDVYVLYWSNPDLYIQFRADLSYAYPDVFAIPLTVTIAGYGSGLTVTEIADVYVHNGYYRHTFRLESSGGGYTLPSGYSHYDFYIDVKGLCSLTTIKSYKNVGMIPEKL
nr:MAG TPA: hypothetical protein [Caudoviricetes sp.]